MKSLSIIVPCYNYEKYIKQFRKAYQQNRKSNIDYEIIIINDGSVDNTKKEIENILINKRINLINNEKNEENPFQ